MSDEQINQAASIMGRKGGRSKSSRKMAAIAANGKRGGRPHGSRDKKPRKLAGKSRELVCDPEFSQEG